MENSITMTFYDDAARTRRILQATVEVIDGEAQLGRPAPSSHWEMEGNLTTARRAGRNG